MGKIETIGDRLRACRSERGLTQKALGDAVGLSKSTVRDIELGRSNSSTRLHALAAHLGVAVTWLETGKGERLPHTPAQVEPTSQILRPDAAKMAAAYGAVLAYGGLLGVQVIALDPKHMEVICLAYERLMLGEKILPLDGGNVAVEEAVKQLGQQGNQRGRHHGKERDGTGGG